MTAEPILQPRLGAFGPFGGRFVAELLWPALEDLDAATPLLETEEFRAELRALLCEWAGRPTPLTRAPRLSERARLSLFCKREDLLHGGAHKTNNAVGQALLARAIGKRRLLCETGAGQHGVAVAMAGARLGMPVVVYMGARDAARQSVNVQRMRLFGADVRAVRDGSATLKDAINEALRDWAASVDDSHYVLGSVCGPDPFPRFVHALQAVIGDEILEQMRAAAGGLPDAVIACVGGGSNAIGAFSPFLKRAEVQLFGAEPAGADEARPGLLHGARTLVLQDGDGQIRASHSIAAGLDYPAIGPEHAMLRSTGRVRYVGVTDEQAVAALRVMCRDEGILPALESSHALALALRAVDEGLLRSGARVVVNVSGRGDKDLDVVGEQP